MRPTVRKFLLPLVLVLAVVTGAFSHSYAFAHDRNAPDDVKAFYSWYIGKQSGAALPLLDKNIYGYVNKETVDRLRTAYRHDRLPGGSDYFTKVQDYDEHDWLANIVVATPVTLGDVTIVPVTFGSKDKVSVIVFLRKQGDAWKIVKVDDTRDFE